MSLVGDDLRGIHNPKVGGSSPPAATNQIKHLRAGPVPALFVFCRNSFAGLLEEAKKEFQTHLRFRPADARNNVASNRQVIARRQVLPITPASRS